MRLALASLGPGAQPAVKAAAALAGNGPIAAVAKGGTPVAGCASGFVLCPGIAAPAPAPCHVSALLSAVITDRGMLGSMGRGGNPYDNAKAASFIKTLKVEAVYPMAFETFQDVIEQLPDFIEVVYNKRRLHSALGYLSPQQFEDQHRSQRAPTRRRASVAQGRLFAHFPDIALPTGRDETRR
jgi:putative transposase